MCAFDTIINDPSRLLPWDDLIEVWRPAPGFSNYEVSNFANFRKVSTKRLLRTNFGTKDKYMKVYFGAGEAAKTHTKRVHRLVALAFCYKPAGKDHVNHNDGNRLNNHWRNLIWSTQQENNAHSYYVLGNKSPMLLKIGEEPVNKIFNPEILEKCVAMFKKGISTEIIGKEVNLDGSTVRKHLRNHFKTSLKQQKLRDGHAKIQ